MTAALEGGEWSAARSGRTLPLGKNQYPFYRRLGGPQGRSGRAENLVPTGIRSPDRPARSQSLYRLIYPPHIPDVVSHIFIFVWYPDILPSALFHINLCSEYFWAFGPSIAVLIGTPCNKRKSYLSIAN